MSVPNQKVVYIHKRKYTGNFLQIGIDEMRLAQQQIFNMVMQRDWLDTIQIIIFALML